MAIVTQNLATAIARQLTNESEALCKELCNMCRLLTSKTIDPQSLQVGSGKSSQQT